MYTEEELLQLAGIQHIAFCERQYSLAYVEQQWSENLLTIEGHHLHEKVDDPFLNEKRTDIITLRSVPVVSYKLGLYGKADVVELIHTENRDNSIQLKNESGWWRINPVEYKRGKPKPDDCDEVQLCAQAICLEEMHDIIITDGCIYYGLTRHRHYVEFNDTLRTKTLNYANRMHQLHNEGKTPLPLFQKRCYSCSLIDVCLPETISNQKSVSSYLHDVLNC